MEGARKSGRAKEHDARKDGEKEKKREREREREKGGNGCARAIEDSFLGKPGFPVISRG